VDDRINFLMVLEEFCVVCILGVSLGQALGGSLTLFYFPPLNLCVTSLLGVG